MAYQYGATHGRSHQGKARTHHSTDHGATAPRAAPEVSTGHTENAPADDPTGSVRIRDAAVELFGEHGLHSVTLKEIATKAGVSAPLVIHHFGSKAGLRKACDEHAAEVVLRTKVSSVEQGEHLSPQYVLAASRETKPILRYLFQAFAAGGEEVDALLDQMIDDSLEYTQEAERRGLVKPSRNPRRRAAMLLLQSFGTMMLHRQLKRLIGSNPVDDPPEQWGPYFDTALEIYHGVFEPGAYESLGEALAQHAADPSTEAHRL